MAEQDPVPKNWYAREVARQEDIYGKVRKVSVVSFFAEHAPRTSGHLVPVEMEFKLPDGTLVRVPFHSAARIICSSDE